MSYRQFTPPRRILMGPGPSDVCPQVLAALSRPTIGHLDPLFIDLMEDIKTLLQYAFQTENPCTMAVSAPGSAGMETCFVNLIEPGDTVAVCVNGVFGQRMVENVKRCGGEAVVIEQTWGRAVDPNVVEDVLKTHTQVKALAFVHAETSTGAISDAQALAALAQRYHCLTIVDAVTSLAGVELKVDQWGIDAIYSGSQKCLSCVPGLSPVSFSDRAVQTIRHRTTPVQSWFLDQTLVMNYWAGDGKRSYHHTAPVNALYGLHEALLLLKQETVEAAWQRHRRQHHQLAAGLSKLGLELVVPTAERLPQLNHVYIPNGVDDAEIRAKLLAEFNLEIGAGLGQFAGKTWRIGLMGYAARSENVALCLAALQAVLANN